MADPSMEVNLLDLDLNLPDLTSSDPSKMDFTHDTSLQILPAAVIAEGEKLFRNGEYEKALVRYNAVLSEDADNISSLGIFITDLP